MPGYCVECCDSSRQSVQDRFPLDSNLLARLGNGISTRQVRSEGFTFQYFKVKVKRRNIALIRWKVFCRLNLRVLFSVIFFKLKF